MFSIKNVIAFVVIGFVALVPVSTVCAGSITAQVPFAFIVNGRVLPPGSYQIQSSQSRAVLSIRNSKSGVLVATNPVRSGESPTKPKLVFERHGSAIYLVGIYMSSEGDRSLTPSFLSERQTAPVALR